MHEKGVMLAPVTVLHLPDPAGLATERLGAERADELLAEGARLPIPDLVDRVVAASATRTANRARPAAADLDG